MKFALNIDNMTMDSNRDGKSVTVSGVTVNMSHDDAEAMALWVSKWETNPGSVKEQTFGSLVGQVTMTPFHYTFEMDVENGRSTARMSLRCSMRRLWRRWTLNRRPAAGRCAKR